MNFVLIDASYFIFFRYYAVKNWWGFARDTSEPKNVEESERGMEKFRTTFISKIEELLKKLNIENHILMVGKDCPQKTIWSHNDIVEYKGINKVRAQFIFDNKNKFKSNKLKNGKVILTDLNHKFNDSNQLKKSQKKIDSFVSSLIKPFPHNKILVLK